MKKNERRKSPNELNAQEKIEFQARLYPLGRYFGFIFFWNISYLWMLLIFPFFDVGLLSISFILILTVMTHSVGSAFRIKINKKGVILFTLVFLIGAMLLFQFLLKYQKTMVY